MVISLVFWLTACNLVPTPQPTPTEEPTAVILNLNSTFWLLDTLDGENPIPVTNITLAFIDGWATGESGCNSYAGEYTATAEGDLGIPFIISTQVLCDDPPGVMEQEEIYQNILDEVYQFGIVDGKLRLDSEGGRYLSFVNIQLP